MPNTDYLFFSSHDGDTPALRAQMAGYAAKGPKLVVAMLGEQGSVCYDGRDYHKYGIVPCDSLVDSMGAGDSYFATFLCSLLKASKTGKLLEGTDSEMAASIKKAMNDGAVFAAHVCAMEGAFGYGTPILGKTEV